MPKKIQERMKMLARVRAMIAHANCLSDLVKACLPCPTFHDEQKEQEFMSRIGSPDEAQQEIQRIIQACNQYEETYTEFAIRILMKLIADFDTDIDVVKISKKLPLHIIDQIFQGHQKLEKILQEHPDPKKYYYLNCHKFEASESDANGKRILAILSGKDKNNETLIFLTDRSNNNENSKNLIKTFLTHYHKSSLVRFLKTALKEREANGFKKELKLALQGVNTTKLSVATEILMRKRGFYGVYTKRIGYTRSAFSLFKIIDHNKTAKYSTQRAMFT